MCNCQQLGHLKVLKMVIGAVDIGYSCRWGNTLPGRLHKATHYMAWENHTQTVSESIAHLRVL
jgi:hypothetical protein